jgi:hypothetical protein
MCSTKYHLKQSVGVTTYTFEELNIPITQVLACLSSYPLTIFFPVIPMTSPTVSNSPGRFLTGERL